MVAMKPEKKIWAAEIELYRLAMSNGPYGYKKNQKMVSMFLDFGGEMSTRYCWQVILLCFRFRRDSESCNFGSQNLFLFKFWSKTFFLDFYRFGFWFFCVLASAEDLKNWISLSKIIFVQILIKNIFIFILDHFREKWKNEIHWKVSKRNEISSNIKKTCMGILFLW